MPIKREYYVTIDGFLDAWDNNLIDPILTEEDEDAMVYEFLVAYYDDQPDYVRQCYVQLRHGARIDIHSFIPSIRNYEITLAHLVNPPPQPPQPPQNHPPAHGR